MANNSKEVTDSKAMDNKEIMVSKGNKVMANNSKVMDNKATVNREFTVNSSKVDMVNKVMDNRDTVSKVTGSKEDMAKASKAMARVEISGDKG